MITITDVAQTKILELMAKSESPVKGLRIGAKSVSPLKVDFRMAFIAVDEDTSADTVIPFEGFEVFADEESAPNIGEAVVDYIDGLMGSGFKIERPLVVPPELSGPVAQRIQQVLDEQVNPAVAGHGGHVSLIDVKDNTAYVQLGGGCQGCGMADVTLKQGIEVMIKEAVPEIEEILDVTEHADGENPYYQSSK
jgi:Fe/S biogenesis protein NfuA